MIKCAGRNNPGRWGSVSCSAGDGPRPWVLASATPVSPSTQSARVQPTQLGPLGPLGLVGRG